MGSAHRVRDAPATAAPVNDPTPQPTTHSTRWWAVLAWVGLIGLGLLSLAQPLSGDQAFFFVVARQLRHGDVLYRDIVDAKQPFIFLFYLVAGGLFGWTAVGAHLLELLWCLAFAVVLTCTMAPTFRHPVVRAVLPAGIGIAYYLGVSLLRPWAGRGPGRLPALPGVVVRPRTGTRHPSRPDRTGRRRVGRPSGAAVQDAARHHSGRPVDCGADARPPAWRVGPYGAPSGRLSGGRLCHPHGHLPDLLRRHGPTRSRLGCVGGAAARVTPVVAADGIGSRAQEAVAVNEQADRLNATSDLGQGILAFGNLRYHLQTGQPYPPAITAGRSSSTHRRAGATSSAASPRNNRRTSSSTPTGRSWCVNDRPS
jgi:hypothetical protein